MGPAYGFSNLCQEQKLPYEKLQAKAPCCLRMFLWSESAGAKFRLVNKFYNSALSSSDSKVLCGLKPVNQKEDQLWSAEVDTANFLVTFSHHAGGNLSSQVEGGTLTLTADGSRWKVKAIDNHHIKLYSEGTIFYLCNLNFGYFLTFNERFYEHKTYICCGPLLKSHDLTPLIFFCRWISDCKCALC